MTDLNALLPDDENDSSGLAAHIGASIIELLPGIGPTAARALDFKVARRNSERDRRFQVAMIAEIKGLWESLKNRPSIEDVIDSDRFTAVFNRCSRAASQTTSETKRARLARAGAAAVLPGTIREAEVEVFLDYIDRYTDLHIWLVVFYCDPEAWLNANDLQDFANPRIRGGKRKEPLDAALNLDSEAMFTVYDAIEDLQRDMMLGIFDLNEDVADRRQYEPQTRQRARRFLRFIGDEGRFDLERPSMN